MKIPKKFLVAIPRMSTTVFSAERLRRLKAEIEEKRIQQMIRSISKTICDQVIDFASTGETEFACIFTHSSLKLKSGHQNSYYTFCGLAVPNLDTFVGQCIDIITETFPDCEISLDDEDNKYLLRIDWSEKVEEEEEQIDQEDAEEETKEQKGEASSDSIILQIPDDTLITNLQSRISELESENARLKSKSSFPILNFFSGFGVIKED